MSGLYSRLMSKRFEAIVFITGAAVLIVEITATRILSPYYGNTIYAVSSIIGVILGALSLGYWRGGVEADATPRMQAFYKVIFQAGASLALLFFLVVGILPRGGHAFSITTGPLFWSVALFFLPNYLLGKCSPFAIVLAKRAFPQKGLGHITGAMFFWSTAGSIAGSLAAGFILIPHLGIRAILALTTGIVLLLGGIGYARHMPRDKKPQGVIMLLALLTITASTFINAAGNKGYLLLTDGVYQRLAIFDGSLKKHPHKTIRFLQQGSNFSAAMYLQDNKPVFKFEKYHALSSLAGKPLKRALVLGAGAYIIPEKLHQDNPQTLIDVVDIEPGLLRYAHDFFSFTADAENRGAYRRWQALSLR